MKTALEFYPNDWVPKIYPQILGEYIQMPKPVSKPTKNPCGRARIASPFGNNPCRKWHQFLLCSQNMQPALNYYYSRITTIQTLPNGGTDPIVNKTFHFWHVFIKNAKAGIHYALRVDGPNDPGAGHRFDREKVLDRTVLKRE
ncbi:MAG: hypothetical protein R3F36_00755 [Candidatus Competibacteraceae bacterium]